MKWGVHFSDWVHRLDEPTHSLEAKDAMVLVGHKALREKGNAGANTRQGNSLGKLMFVGDEGAEESGLEIVSMA